jgi:hypothetical protein
MGHVDAELIAAASAYLAASDAYDEAGEKRDTLPVGALTYAFMDYQQARLWLAAVLADRPTPVGTTPSPEYAPACARPPQS